MHYESIPEARWRIIQNAPSSAQDVRIRCERILRSLRAVFSDPGNLYASGLEISETDPDSPILALIKTPFGSGRLRLSWTIDAGELAGMIVVEREAVPPKEDWDPVWGIVVPKNDNPYAGRGDAKQEILLDRQLGNHLSRSIFEIGMSMVFAIGLGPLELTRDQ